MIAWTSTARHRTASPTITAVLDVSECIGLLRHGVDEDVGHPTRNGVCLLVVPPQVLGVSQVSKEGTTKREHILLSDLQFLGHVNDNFHPITPCERTVGKLE